MCGEAVGFCKWSEVDRDTYTDGEVCSARVACLLVGWLVDLLVGWINEVYFFGRLFVCLFARLLASLFVWFGLFVLFCVVFVGIVCFSFVRFL